MPYVISVVNQKGGVGKTTTVVHLSAALARLGYPVLKARQVLEYLTNIRSLERPAYTVPVGYAHISATADVHPHYLQRNV
ncbi:MAG TPA: ParA family protein, partial [Candidatus Tectomicrobia bacterium]